MDEYKLLNILYLLKQQSKQNLDMLVQLKNIIDDIRHLKCVACRHYEKGLCDKLKINVEEDFYCKHQKHKED